MRVQFISPVFVPGLKEPSLRVDFNFAEYLARSYAGMLTRFWKLSLLGMLFTFGSLFILSITVEMWTIEVKDSLFFDQILLSITVTLPALILLFSWLAKNVLFRIKMQLSSQVAGPFIDQPLPPELLSIDGIKCDNANQPLPIYLTNITTNG